MIQLHSRHRLVAADDGTVRSFDGEALRHDLRCAFRACGITDDWAADHIACVIEEHLSSRPAADLPPLPERDLHAMVLALLPAAGFADVGQAYQARLPAAAVPPDPDPFREWDRARIATELAGVLPLAEEECARIASQTESALRALGLDRVRSELIRSLANHFLHQTGASGAPQPSPESPWCLRPEGWPVAGVAGAEALVRAGALRPLPVSRFLPRLRLELDLRRLAAACGTPPLPEIVFLPALARALDCAVRLLALAGEAVRGILKPDASAPPAHVLVRGLEETVDHAILPQSARARKALCREIRATIEAKFPERADGSLLLTFH